MTLLNFAPTYMPGSYLLFFGSLCAEAGCYWSQQNQFLCF